jgi:hypothetical protein
MTAVIDTIADNNDEYPFNYFPKQIHDAKTVLTVASSTQDKIYFDLLEVI